MKHLLFDLLFENLILLVPDRMQSDIVFNEEGKHRPTNSIVYDTFDDLLVPFYKDLEYPVVANFYHAVYMCIHELLLYTNVVHKNELRKETIKRKFEELLLWLLKNQKGMEGYGVDKINFPSNQIDMVYEYFRVNGVELPEELKEVPKKP